MPHVHFWTLFFSCGPTGNARNVYNCAARPSALWTQRGRCGLAYLTSIKLCPKQECWAARQVPGGSNIMFGVEKSFGKAAVVTFPDN